MKKYSDSFNLHFTIINRLKKRKTPDLTNNVQKTFSAIQTVRLTDSI